MVSDFGPDGPGQQPRGELGVLRISGRQGSSAPDRQLPSHSLLLWLLLLLFGSCPGFNQPEDPVGANIGQVGGESRQLKTQAVQRPRVDNGQGSLLVSRTRPHAEVRRAHGWQVFGLAGTVHTPTGRRFPGPLDPVLV
ncbi:hypothetical protein GCM10010492_01410 [Saccharothrix mutabilis subsp. mutabilis]|uniref:Uncharacterized protein n=1 Tax=Saccharothrix mutabilis subsp. mutabilis TaxID=66855 RepID=A0ABP3CJI3_9PSEU